MAGGRAGGGGLEAAAPADFKLTEPKHADLVDAAGAMDVDAVVTWLFQFAGK
jgi:hypothetical protein